MLQGLNDEQDNYRKQADYIKQAFNNRFYDVSRGYYHEEDTTELVLGAQILPLAFGLADETQTKNIEDNIKKYANELDGGIFTIKYLFPILTKMGLESRLYKWITEKKAPSWGYWLSFGDCSLWEQ